jgi:cytochrome c553
MNHARGAICRQSFCLVWLVLSALAFGAVGQGLAIADDGAPKTTPAAADAPSFDQVIGPLFQTKCGRCHGKTVQKAELALHTAERIRKGGESGPVIVPGKSTESLLYEKIYQEEMPPDGEGRLTAAEVESVQRWIDGGALLGSSTTVKPIVTQHDVIPILLLRCITCHGRQKQEAGLDLRTRQAMLKGGKSGPAIVPGKPEDSLILKRIRSEEMPPRKRLIEAMVKPVEADEVAKLARWIELGSPEAADEPDLAGTAADPLVRLADRDFWSFRPPQSAAAPQVTHGDRVRNPIDAFVLQKLEEKKLSLAPEADRLTLLRRATFDLTGLPPEPAEIETFLADDSTNAYENLIEKLLASPRYGERWGRHWLDVAGYADCEGKREQHLPRPFAWRYRDYVIRSLNADKPYDRFLIEQLAGDELVDYEHAAEITPEIEDNLVATGFLRMAPDPTWANLTGFVPDRIEVIADAMDVLGSGVMGLTIKCARCHSHKFDPIPHRDYYRLAALFKGAYDEHDWLKPQLIAYGGAVSAGLGERYLPYVTDAERNRWREECKKFESQVAALKAVSQTPDTEKKIKALEARRPEEPRIMALWDRGEPSPSYLYRRGDYQTPGGIVHPGPPAVLTNEQVPFEIAPPWPGAKPAGRRLAFARWLTNPRQPLTARVMVNRIWKHHFGHGLVRSLGNFGKTGDRPTHPELLDWLACEFVRQGWSLKQMHRLMMTSSVYRQSSAVPTIADDRLLSQMPLRRMEAEELRDALLFVAGQLDQTRYGPADPVRVLPDGLVQSGKRRSIYVQQLRKHPASLLESFDLPAMNPNCLQRQDSLVALQALHLLNDTAVRELAGQLADRTRSVAGDAPAQQIGRLYMIALGRPPDANEEATCVETLAKLTEQWAKRLQAAGAPASQEAERRALTTICHTIMNSAMFLYID